MRRFTFVFVAVLLSFPALAADPGAAIRKARQALNEKRYDDAIQLLQGAIPDAAALAEPQHSQALAALHFYTALAFNGLQDDDKTREELDQFFRFNPTAKALDPARYDATFVRLFSEVSRAPRTAPETGGSNFDEVYPGYANFRERDPRIPVVEQWGDGPELQLLGSPDEKRDWRKLADDEARRAFVESFWKRRDKNPPRGIRGRDLPHREVARLAHRSRTRLRPPRTAACHPPEAADREGRRVQSRRRRRRHAQHQHRRSQ
jgi:hypothetical protein